MIRSTSGLVIPCAFLIESIPTVKCHLLPPHHNLFHLRLQPEAQVFFSPLLLCRQTMENFTPISPAILLFDPSTGHFAKELPIVASSLMSDSSPSSLSSTPATYPVGEVGAKGFQCAAGVVYRMVLVYSESQDEQLSVSSALDSDRIFR